MNPAPGSARILLVSRPVIFLLLLLAAAAPATRATAVIDGRSFLTDDGLRVRLLGVETPRVYEPGGDICRDVLEKFVTGRPLRLEVEGPDADAEGWLLRHVFAGDTFVNEMMVRKGYAALAPADSGRYHDTLGILERSSARVEKGLWPFGIFPPPRYAGREPGLADTSAADPWLETVSYDRADRYYGRIVRVVGTVVATYRTDRVFIMNFHQDYRRYFKAVIFPGDIGKFPPHPEDYYKKRVIRVTGLVREYQGAPQIVVNDPGQIEVIE